MRKEIEANDKWYRMDNSADLYPMSSTQTTMSIFRLSVEMANYVDSDNLQSAVAAILPRFPTFAVMLRKGFFRYYFDNNEAEPVVHLDNGIVFQKIDFIKNNRFLFRVMYYKKRISVDFFHGLCDATGAMEFLRALVYSYLLECGVTDLPMKGDIKLVGEEIRPAELEDSISKYYTQYKLFGGVVTKMAGKNCFGIKGKRFKKLGYGIIHGYVSADEFRKLAKEYDCTVTVLIAAIALFSIYKVYVKADDSDDLVAMIPINLRKVFPSETLLNFTTMTKCIVNPAVVKPELIEYVRLCKTQIADSINNKNELAEKLSLSAFMSAKWFMKYLPVGFKSFVTRAGKALSTKTKQTLIISNYGIVRMPQGMERYVRRFTFNVNISKKVPVNIGVVTYNDVMAISFTRMLVSTEFEREFFTTLTNAGLKVEVVSNLREQK